jgi:hypothetical protein
LEALGMPVCRSCHNYVLKIDKRNPCPHCGNEEPLSKNRKMKSVIPDDLQYDFKEKISDLANRTSSLTFDTLYGDLASHPKISQLITDKPKLLDSQTKVVSQNLPLEFLFPHLENSTLDPASLKVYFQLAVEYQIIVKKAPTFQQGVYHWSLLLPDRLQEYGLTLDAWEKISSIGDNDPIIQGEVQKIIDAIPK